MGGRRQRGNEFRWKIAPDLNVNVGHTGKAILISKLITTTYGAHTGNESETAAAVSVGLRFTRTKYVISVSSDKVK